LPPADTEEVGARKAACNNAPDFSLAAFRPGALPPEPVEVLLPKAKYVIEASVARVLYQGEKPERDTEEHVAGPIPPDRCQVVQLDVTRRVAGAPARRSRSSSRCAVRAEGRAVDERDGVSR
jgi:hypothetical protein